MSKALKNVNVHVTRQSERAEVSQVKNNAGGFSFEVDKWQRLERFLILGTDGGTYYVGERDLTKENVDFVRELLRTDSAEVIRRTVDVSVNARALKNSSALFVLALAMNTDGVDKAAVKDAVQKVARTSTHLFEYMQYLENLGGWGRAKKASVAEWYTSKTADQLALQVVKYRQRNGWTHRDAFRLSHPVDLDQNVGNFVLGKEYVEKFTPRIIVGFDRVQSAKTAGEVVSLIKEFNLPWEAVPTQWHKNLDVWRSLFEAGMGQSALIRNVTRFAKLGAFNDLKFAAEYANALADPSRIVKGKIHPINYLNASVVYSEGQIDRNNGYGWGSYRNKNWETNSKVAGALNDGFYLAFKNVEPANKRTKVALDVSGSMSTAAMGLDLTCMQVGAAVAMQIARTEPYSEIVGFSHQLVDLKITEKDTLEAAMAKIQRTRMGGTDCALPMLDATKRQQEIDTFVVITDSETWFGNVHPHQALKNYRKAFVPDARLAVLGVEGNKFTIADPKDAGSMDFVGFDSNGPKVLADFSAGRL